MNDRRLHLFLSAVLLISLSYHLYTSFVGISLPLIQWRETQVAIGVDFLLKGGPWLQYETPVLGPPWSIPMEFPLFHWTAALLVAITGWSSALAGRLVSMAYYFLGFWPLSGTLRLLGLDQRGRWVFYVLFLMSPMYLYFSRTVMVESLALTLSLFYLRYFLGWLYGKERLAPIWGTLAGVLAAVVKITTLAAFAYLAAVLVVAEAWRRKSETVRLFGISGVLFAGIPLAAGLLWTDYADYLKELNPVARDFITSTALRTWNFGTWEQLFEWTTWKDALFRRDVHNAIGQRALFVGSFIVVLITRLYWKHYFAGVVLFLSGTIVFTNLYRVHDYYAYATCIFLLGSLAWLIRGLLQGGRVRQTIGCLLLLFAVGGSIEHHRRFSFLWQQEVRSDFDELGHVLQEKTSPDGVLLFYGLDWWPIFAQRAQRRAIMHVDQEAIDSPRMKEALMLLEPYHVEAMVVCGEHQMSRKDEIRKRLRVLGLSSDASGPYARCWIFGKS